MLLPQTQQIHSTTSISINMPFFDPVRDAAIRETSQQPKPPSIPPLGLFQTVSSTRSSGTHTASVGSRARSSPCSSTSSLTDFSATPSLPSSGATSTGTSQSAPAWNDGNPASSTSWISGLSQSSQPSSPSNFDPTSPSNTTAPSDRSRSPSDLSTSSCTDNELQSSKVPLPPSTTARRTRKGRAPLSSPEKALQDIELEASRHFSSYNRKGNKYGDSFW